MKTVFVTIFDGAISKNVLRTDIARILLDRYRIVFFVPANKIEYYKSEFTHTNAIFEVTPRADYPLFERRFHALALSSLHTNTVQIKIYHDYVAKRDLLRVFFRFVLWQVGRIRTFHRLMRWVYWHVQDTSFDAFFDKYSPSGVFVPNMISNEDFRLVKAARRHGVISLGMPKSWDNFTGKTFFNIFPDWVMVQNEVMFEQAQKLYNYPKERLTQVGFPSFDVYHDPRLLTRAAFCARMGLDPTKKIILYAAAGHQLAPRDEHVLNFLIQNISVHADLKDRVQVLVRPHPKYEFRKDIIATKPFVVIDAPGISITEKSGSWEFKDGDVSHLTNSIAHMDLLISTMSTLNLEGAIFDKPLISIGFEADKQYPLADSTARYYGYEQTQEFIHTGGVSIAYNGEEFIRQIVAYLRNPALHSGERKRLVKRMVGDVDGNAGKRVAACIIDKIG